MITELDVRQLRSAMEKQVIGQSELVERSGVSRAQLSRLLSQNRARVREQTISRLAAGLGIDPSDLALEGRRQGYLDWVADTHGFVDFRGIGMPQFQQQEIDAIFVEPEVVAQEGDDDCDPASDAVQRRLCPQVPSLASESVLTQDRVVVLGHPGSGKTTFLRWLACQAALDKLGTKATPIYLRLPELSRALEIDAKADPVRLIASAAASRGCPEVEGLLRDDLANERRLCLVMLDGLDEVGDEDRREELVRAVKRFVAQYPRNRFVLTSRLVGFDASPWTRSGFSIVRLSGYGRKQLKEFVEKWAKILPRIFGRTEEDVRASLETAIFSHARLRTLASNPLVLTILALLNESRGGALPRRRVDLYAKVVEIFLDTWERTKRSSDTFDETSDIDLDAREFGWLLSDLALAMQKNHCTLAARWWISERILDCLQIKLGFASEQAKDAGDRIIRYLTERTGLLEERGLDQFGFSHRTIQEYFAASGAIDEADASTTRDVSDSMRGYFYHPQWSEVVRLVAAQLTPRVAESLICSIVDDPDPVGRFLKRGPLLALRCLSDGATVPNRRLVNSIFDSVADLGRSKWLGITLEAICVLESFEGTRLEKTATETIETILETAKQELDSDDYICLYQHAHWSETFEQAEPQLGSDFASEAAREVKVDIAAQSYSIVYFNGALRVEQPEIWFESICSLLQDDGQSLVFREFLVRELGRQVETDPTPRRALRKLLLASTMPSQLRSACVSALATGARTSDSRLLLRVLQRENDAKLRAACAAGLKHIACSDHSVHEKLLEILNSNAPVELRAGAARGLEKVAREDEETTAALLSLANQDDSPDDLRSACAWALEEQIGRVPDIANSFKAWIDAAGDTKLRRVAAQALAHAMADEDLPWDHHVVEQIEHVLMNLDDPCPHALDSLGALATAREVRRGLRLEKVLRDALKPLADRIELSFVFGSTARRRQTEDSDIDLMLIGNVKLKDLSSALRDAEKTLGKRVNPALYTRRSFQKKYQSGDPFLVDVYRREKMPVIPSGASRRELDDELRAMVAERLASTG